MLEDTFSDIISKARFGLDLSLSDLAQQARLSVRQVQRLLQGEVAPVQVEIERLAPPLRLSTRKLLSIALEGWEPDVMRIGEGRDALCWIQGRMGDYPVNGYLLIDRVAQRGVLFDTGLRPEEVRAILNGAGATLAAICITHAHADHIGGVDAIHAATGAPIYIHPNERARPRGTIPIQANTEIVAGPFRIQPLMTWGHTPGGVSFFIAGRGTVPMAFVGDALFAGSLGRAASPLAYPTLLTSVRQNILSLPGETTLFPGHGPATTVLQERSHNPFFPEEYNTAAGS